MIPINETITRDWIITLMSEGYDTYDIVKNYDLTEDLILESYDLLDKEVIKIGFSISENFIKRAIEIQYFSPEDIRDLSMSSYSNFTEDFIKEFGEYINWSRMILYISTQSDSFDKYIEIIDKNNLWSYISANDLDVNFIRQYKHKLDWSLLSMVKCFSDDEKEEFSEYILYNESKEIEGDFIDKSQFEFVKKMTDEELEELIEAINSNLQDRIPGWPKK